jgi:far upstream element-binding protein
MFCSLVLLFPKVFLFFVYPTPPCFKQIPNKDVGIVIGRGGCVIKDMQNKTGCRIQIPSHPTQGQANRIAAISGSEEGCSQVQKMIESIIINQSSNGIMSGPGPSHGGAYGHQDMYGQQQARQVGQYASNSLQGAPAEEVKDYSAEWAAYYAAQALAETKDTSPTPATATAEKDLTDPTAYHDDFWRYAALYGEAAAREYYKAWSPPVGTANPNSMTSVQAPTPAAPQLGRSDTKETSVRKVSNLPAWMSKSTAT